MLFLTNWIESKDQINIIESSENHSDLKLAEYIYQLHLLFSKKEWQLLLEMKDVRYEKYHYHEYVNYVFGVTFLEMDMIQKAIDHLSKSVASAPHFSGARYRLARALMKQKLYSYSKVHFFAHINSSDKPAYSHLFLSDIFLKEKNIKLAWQHLLTAKELGVPDEKIFHRESKLKQAIL